MKKSQSLKRNTKRPVEDVISVPDTNPDEDQIAEDQFAVASREDEASSTGHRIEPIINDEEGNAEKLIEEGLHGYMHRSKKDR